MIRDDSEKVITNYYIEFAQFAAYDTFTRLLQVAIKNKEYYNEIMDGILKLTNKYKTMDLEINESATVFLQWDLGEWSLVHWRGQQCMERYLS